MQSFICFFIAIKTIVAIVSVLIDPYYQQLQLLYLILLHTFLQTSNSGFSQSAWIPVPEPELLRGARKKSPMALAGSHFSFIAFPSALQNFSSPSNALSHSHSGH